MPRGYLAMRMTRWEECLAGPYGVHSEDGSIGFMRIYRTKTAARKELGRNVRLLEIEWDGPERKEADHEKLSKA